MSEQKTYLDGFIIKEKQFDNGNSILNVAVNAEQMIRFVNEHKDERGWLRIGISKRRTPSDKGVTHCAWLDTWKPQQRQESPCSTHYERPIEQLASKQQTSADNLPF